MKLSEKLPYAAAAVLFLAGIALRFVPGVRFSGYLCLGLAGLCGLWLILGRWAEKSVIGKWCKRIFLVCLAAVTVVLCAFETAIVTRGEEDWSALPVDAVIVLGAGVNGETPSMALQTRIDAAAAYLEQHPDVPVVLSGGQGSGEDITEAEAMRRALKAKGMPEDRLLLEESSTSTAENFAFSKVLLEDHDIDTDTAVIAVVTNDFHIFRAKLIAQREGLTVIDFKSDRIAPGTEAQAALRHKLQVDIYAQAAQKIFGLPVREKLVFFLRTGLGQPV